RRVEAVRRRCRIASIHHSDPLRHVGAGAEGDVAGARYDGDQYLVIGVQGFGRLDQGVVYRAVDRVALLRAVDADDSHRTVPFHRDYREFVLHTYCLRVGLRRDHRQVDVRGVLALMVHGLQGAYTVSVGAHRVARV